MAAPRKFPKKITENYYCKIPLRGIVAPHSKARLVTETLKHLMFQRQQIPLPFEQLKYQQKIEEQSVDESTKRKKPLSLEHKRWAALIHNTDELIDNIETLFCTCKVSQLLIIFGATVISPKEVHHITFTDHTDGSPSDDARLSTKHCQRQLMRAMITNNTLIDAKTLPLTSTHLMVFAHRESGIEWFKPKATFRMTERGQHYTFEVECGSVQMKEHNSIGSTGDSHESSSSSESSSESVDEDITGTLSDCDIQDTHMWFQSPVTIKGVKDKSSKKASNSDIWM